VLLWILAFFTVLFFRYVIKVLLDKTDFISEPVLLMGTGTNAEIIINHLRSDMGFPYRFIGCLEDEQADPAAGPQLPRLGTFAEAASVIRETEVQKVLVIASGLGRERIQDIVYELQPLVRSVSVIPDVKTLPFLTMDIESLIDGRIVMFRMRNNLRNRWNRAFKCIFDWCATLLGSIIISPVMLVIALWIWTDSPGPVIFKHSRVGQYGKEFNCYKFRTMCADAEEKLEELLEADPEAKKEWEENYKLKNDPRITRSGKFLRRTSLDELPQIFNVLKGEMSLVGPRPIVAEEIRYYGKFIEDYYMVRPGITGMWQTGGRNDTGYEQRVRMDSWYVRNWDFWFDIVLLWRTLKVVIKGDGAY
jgi:undecaprenyl-phosphate galactose phosphotransferase